MQIYVVGRENQSATGQFEFREPQPVHPAGDLCRAALFVRQAPTIPIIWRHIKCINFRIVKATIY